MECFDPVGVYREQYRLSKGVQRTAATALRFLHKDYIWQKSGLRGSDRWDEIQRHPRI